MASQSPAKGKERETAPAYLTGWAALTRLMNEGLSWSGRERNNCLVNLGDGRFADASFASGLDFLDDGRAVAGVDWDGDGDLDLWLKNRTGPQLRLMRNDHAGGEHWLELRLEGVRANRDAVGARVEVRAGGTRWVRAVTAGDGYLSQSSRTLHFGLGEAGTIDEVTIDWPGAARERLGVLAVDRAYRVREGAGTAVSLPPRAVRLGQAPAVVADRAGASRLLLRIPLALPPTIRDEISDESSAGRVMLINLWAHWCAPCNEELSLLADSYPRIHAAGIDVVALSLDAPEDRERAAAFFVERIAPRMQRPAFGSTVATDSLHGLLEAILDHVRGRSGEMSLPTSLLVDGGGRLQMVYLGPIDPERLVADAAEFASDAGPLASRRSLTHGHWYFRTPRNLIDLAGDLKRRGFARDARFYLGLAKAFGP